MSVKQINTVLRALNGELQGLICPIVEGLTLGRSTDCGLFVPDRRVSREHARFVSDAEQLWLEDLDSHNGTYLNGQRISKAEVFNGDLIRVGTAQFTLEARELHDSSAVRVVSDAAPPSARVLQKLGPDGVAHTLNISAGGLFKSLGLSDTERIDTAEQVRSLVQKAKRFAVLYEISKGLQKYAQLRETLPGLLDLLLESVDGDSISVVMVEGNGSLVPRHVRHRDKTAVASPATALTLSKTVVDWVMQERCAVITADASQDERFSASESIMLAQVRSLLVVPMLVEDRILGLIEVENNRNINSFDENDLHLVSVVASMLAVAMDHLEVTQARERLIVQLQAAQEQLLATQERLIVSERMGLLGRLASGITHEVKNHLSPFMLADMIANKYPQDQEIQDAAELMLEAQAGILSLVDEIRSFASGSQARVDIALHDVAALIESVLRFLSCDRAIKNATLEFVPTVRPQIHLDAHRIRQVLINLIRNAVDALSFPGGRVEIRLLATELDVIIEVRDNGSGISPEAAPRVFEPFFTTKEGHGLGLGLDISRQIALAHRGSLTFESRRGAGTVFRLTLPQTNNDSEPLPYDDTRTDPHAMLSAIGMDSRAKGR